MTQALCIGLALSILCSTTPAAPKVIVGVAQEWRVGAGFWWRSSPLIAALSHLAMGAQTPSPKRQEKQRDRDTRVSRLQIYPGDVTLQVEQKATFSAIAYDKDETPVGGVQITWSAQDEDRNQAVGVSRRGDFVARTPGKFKLIAEAGGKKAMVKVIVVEGAERKRGDKPARQRKISTRDLPSPAAAKTNQKTNQSTDEQQSAHASRSSKSNGASLAHAAAPTPMLPPSPEYGGDNYWSADDPGNQVGDPPGGPTDGGAGSGNFQIAAPLLHQPGRGIDISLGLVYNSRLWNKAGSQISYDIDRDWPAPGWSLGFGKMIGMGVDNGSMLVEADGTRHGYGGTVSYCYNYACTDFTGHSTDGSFIDYYHHTGTGGAMTYGYARYPNGTMIEYSTPGPGALYPTRITDANGNYITITYVNNVGPNIQTVTDTLGRVINFYYDYNNLLTAVVGPGMNGGTRTLARLHYRQFALNYGFSGSMTPAVRNSTPWLIDAIYFPGTATGYWFGDTDSFSPYGMLAKVSDQRAMGFSSSSLNDQGSVSPGSVSKQEAYNYPMSPNYSLTDAPTYSTKTETWDGMTTGAAVTSYDVYQNASPRTVTVTLPNGTKSIQTSYNYSYLANTDPLKALDGVVYQEEVRDAANNQLQVSNSTWETGAYGSLRPTRTTHTDERGQVTATEFSYGPSYNQVTEMRDYDYGGTTLQRLTRTQYDNSASYTNRHIFNLVNASEIYAGDGVTRVSRTEYQHDGQTMSDTPNVVMHNDSSNPYAPQYLVPGQCWYTYDEYGYYYYQCDPDYWATDYDSSTDYRGNITQITTYADAVTPSNPLSESRRYDITGNMVSATTACCQQMIFNYTADMQYAYALSKTRGSATDTSAQVRTSSTYDFNTGLITSATDADGRTSQNTFIAETLRPQTSYLSTGAYMSYAYDDAGMSVTETTYTSSGGIAEQNVKRLNGMGEVKREESLGGGGAWDVVETQYDAMNRPSQQSRPYRSGSEQPQWSVSTYDALNRVTAVQMPDGSVSQTFYNEPNRPSAASTAPGETARQVDAWGREHWARMDSLDRTVEVVEPDPAGNGSVASGGMQTSYTYNTLDKVTNIVQGSQQRSFRYDSLGRLTHQKLAETSATLNDAGQYVGGGSWSDFFTYDDRSNITSRTDARGVKTVYTYNNDPLNRLQQVSYDTSGFGDTANPILAAPTVTYSYVTTGDVSRLNSITTAGVSTETMTYDGEGRVSTDTQTLTSRSGYPMVTDYIYDTLNRVTDTRYPAEYANGSAPRKVIHQDYDTASRLSGLQVDGASYASEVEYNASSQATSLRVGATSGLYNKVERYRYNAQNGLLEEQMVLRDGISWLLDLSYDYTGANGKRTGQLVKITNNLDTSQNHDRSFSYDALGRLTQAKGGPNSAPLWTQNYQYDRFGNRTSASASGNTAGTAPPTCSGSQTLSTEQFVRSFYQGSLNRQPNATELQSWTDLLRQSYWQGSSQELASSMYMGRQLFKSQEYLNRARSDRDYVYDLYAAYLGRTPDQGGWDWWTGQVAANGRDAVRAGFEYSQEFSNRVSSMCPRGSGASTPIPADGLNSVSYDATSNRINNAGFSYDAAGNQTRVLREDGSGQRFQYDAAGRMVKVRDDYNYTLATYTYGSDNRRLISQDGDENSNYRTYYAWLDEDVIAEYSETPGAASVPQWSKSYIYLGARLLSTLTPNGGGGEVAQYHHPDRLGTRLITNSTDAGVQEQVALPFGTALDGESTGASKQRFTSYDRSPMTGLDYAVNRHYDSQQGRFTQVDPIGMNAVSLENPQSLNLYAYCGNDPVNHLDPNGLFWGALKRFFHKVGKFLSAVSNAIMKVLNNRWVSYILQIVSFIVPFLGPSLGILIRAAHWLTKAMTLLSNIASLTQMAGEVLQGHWKQLGIMVGMAYLGGALAVIEDNIKANVIQALKRNGRISIRNISFKKLFHGAWTGLKDGVAKVKDNFTQRSHWWQKLLPAWGNYCMPGVGRGGPPNNGPMVDTNDGLCGPHDTSYNTHGANLLHADEKLLIGLITSASSTHLLDLAFRKQPHSDMAWRFFAIPVFASLATYRRVSGHIYKK